MTTVLQLFSASSDEPLRQFRSQVRAAALAAYPGPGWTLDDRTRRAAEAAAPADPFADVPRLVEGPDGAAVEVFDAGREKDGVPPETGQDEDVRVRARLVLRFAGDGRVLEFRPSQPVYYRATQAPFYSPAAEPQQGQLPRGRVFVQERLIKLDLTPIQGAPFSGHEVKQLRDCVGRNLDRLRHEAGLFFAPLASVGSIFDLWKDLDVREKKVAKARERAEAQLLGTGIRLVVR